jgi:hypothetical protein
MNYLATATSELVARIPSEARIVLHLACGPGSLGAQYKRINPLAKIVGVEANAVVAAEARSRLDLVYTSDLSSNLVPFYDEIAEGSVDCIIYGEIFVDDEMCLEVIRRHRKFLTENAAVLLCLPNVENWRSAENMLKGTIANLDGESFFSKRIHLLTDSEVRAALVEIGLRAIDTTALTEDLQSLETFIDAVAPALTNAGVDLAGFRDRSAASHRIWRARRQATVAQLTVASTMLTPVGGVSEVRVTEPMQALKAEPSLVTIIVANGDAPMLRAEEPKIFIFHRPLLAGTQGIARVRALLNAGWLLVCEFDDHPDYIPVLQRPDIQNFRAVHAIQTTTQALASVLRQYNPEVAAFENAVATLPNVRNFVNEDHTTLFFAGLNRENEWPPYMNAINAVSARLGSRLRFEVVGDRAFFDSLQTEYKNFTPICDYSIYKNILSSCEISFMPLSDTPFNICKSDLKYIEAASHRVVALASPVVYSSVIDDDRTGVLFKTSEELEFSLTQLVAAPEMARSLANASRQYVENERMLNYQLLQRSDWYHSLWQRKDQLNSLLRQRVPEL